MANSTVVRNEEEDAPKIFSHNFEFFAGKQCDLGIDEAGRGPVLGPMIYGCGISLSDSVEDLKKLGVADSKALTEEKREAIFERVSDPEDESCEFFGYVLQVFSAQYISRKMLQKVKFSLNDISHTAAIHLIQTCLDHGLQVQNVFIDTVGTAESYQEKLLKVFPSLSITVAKKADSLYPVVSASSICAKVTRDRLLKEWTFAESGLEIPENGFGSGYPSDPSTVEFMERCLEKVFGYPSLVRFSWSTAQKLLDSKAVKVKWEDDESSCGGSKSLLSYFSKNKELPIVQRHAYFVDRHLQSATSF